MNPSYQLAQAHEISKYGFYDAQSKTFYEFDDLNHYQAILVIIILI